MFNKTRSLLSAARRTKHHNKPLEGGANYGRQSEHPTLFISIETHDYTGAYQGEIYKKGMEGTRPTVTTDSRFWEEEARKRLSANAFGYVAGLFQSQ